MKRVSATYLFRFIAPLTVAIILCACASQRVNPLLSQTNDVEISKKDFAKKTRQAQELWPLRHQKDALLAFIALEDELSRSNQKTRQNLVSLAHAYYLLAEYHIDAIDEKARVWELGSNWAEKAIEQKILPNQTLSRITTKEAEALFWFASNLGRWATTQGLSQVLKYKDRVKKMIDRVAELQPNFGYGAVYRYYGVYYALLPGYTEDDLKKSKLYFETALKKYPEYFSNHVLYAQYYAAKVANTELTKQHLNYVLKTNAKNTTLKDVYPEQVLEQIRAKKILEGSKP